MELSSEIEEIRDIRLLKEKILKIHAIFALVSDKQNEIKKLEKSLKLATLENTKLINENTAISKKWAQAKDDHEKAIEEHQGKIIQQELDFAMFKSIVNSKRKQLKIRYKRILRNKIEQFEKSSLEKYAGNVLKLNKIVRALRKRLKSQFAGPTCKCMINNVLCSEMKSLPNLSRPESDASTENVLKSTTVNVETQTMMYNVTKCTQTESRKCKSIGIQCSLPPLLPNSTKQDKIQSTTSIQTQTVGVPMQNAEAQTIEECKSSTGKVTLKRALDVLKQSRASYIISNGVLVQYSKQTSMPIQENLIIRNVYRRLIKYVDRRYGEKITQKLRRSRASNLLNINNQLQESRDLTLLRLGLGFCESDTESSGYGSVLLNTKKPESASIRPANTGDVNPIEHMEDILDDDFERILQDITIPSLLSPLPDDCPSDSETDKILNCKRMKVDDEKIEEVVEVAEKVEEKIIKSTSHMQKKQFNRLANLKRKIKKCNQYVVKKKTMNDDTHEDEECTIGKQRIAHTGLSLKQVNASRKSIEIRPEHEPEIECGRPMKRKRVAHTQHERLETSLKQTNTKIDQNVEFSQPSSLNITETARCVTNTEETDQQLGEIKENENREDKTLNTDDERSEIITEESNENKETSNDEMEGDNYDLVEEVVEISIYEQGIDDDEENVTVSKNIEEAFIDCPILSSPSEILKTSAIDLSEHSYAKSYAEPQNVLPNSPANNSIKSHINDGHELIVNEDTSGSSSMHLLNVQVSEESIMDSPLSPDVCDPIAVPEVSICLPNEQAKNEVTKISNNQNKTKYDDVKKSLDRLVCFKGNMKIYQEELGVLNSLDCECLAKYVVHYLKSDKNEVEKQSSNTSEPLLTVKHKVMIGILLRYDKENDVDTISNVIDAIEYYLLWSAQRPENAQTNLCRLYAALCRLRQLKSRVLSFIADLLYFAPKQMFAIIYKIITNWFNILKPYQEGEKCVGIVSTLHYFVHSANINDDSTIIVLRSLLATYYKFPRQIPTADDMMTDLIEAYMCEHLAEYEISILIMCVRNSPAWTTKKVELIRELCLISKDEETIVNFIRLIAKICVKLPIISQTAVNSMAVDIIERLKNDFNLSHLRKLFVKNG